MRSRSPPLKGRGAAAQNHKRTQARGGGHRRGAADTGAGQRAPARGGGRVRCEGWVKVLRSARRLRTAYLQGIPAGGVKVKETFENPSAGLIRP